jgi:hypothetical protein
MLLLSFGCSTHTRWAGLLLRGKDRAGIIGLKQKMGLHRRIWGEKTLAGLLLLVWGFCIENVFCEGLRWDHSR